MTFTEAAIQVLKLAGKPLHYKKITEIAIEQNLLSHVGKTPEITMSSRLATMIKRDRGSAPLVKVKPGVFGLKDFSAEVLSAAENDSGMNFSLAQAKEKAELKEKTTAKDVAETTKEESSEDDSSESGNSNSALPGAEVFPEEDDDDEPILASLEDKNGDRSRRRRKRRRPGEEQEEKDSAHSRRNERGRREERREKRERSSSSSRNRREERRDERESLRSRKPQKEQSVTPFLEPLNSSAAQRGPAEDSLLGKELNDAVVYVLDHGRRQPLSPLGITELLIRKGRLKGEAEALLPTVLASIHGDIARAKSQGKFSKFRWKDGKVALAEWDLSREEHKADKELSKALRFHSESVRKHLISKLTNIPMSSFMEVLATWLNAEGVTGLRAIPREGAEEGTVHLSGVLKRGVEEVRLAIVVWVNGGQIGREAVIDIRGALHHYNQAEAAWLITTKQVLSGARDEIKSLGAATVVLYDGYSLADSLTRKSLGVTRIQIPVSMIDMDFFDAFGGLKREPENRETQKSQNMAEGRRGGRRERGRDKRRRERQDAEFEADLEKEEKSLESGKEQDEEETEPKSSSDRKAPSSLSPDAQEANESTEFDGDEETRQQEQVDPASKAPLEMSIDPQSLVKETNEASPNKTAPVDSLDVVNEQSKQEE